MLPHPVTGETVVGMVARGGTKKLANWRERPYANVVIRSGGQWAAAEGRVDLIGPDDPAPGIDAERLRLLLREIFTAAGGTHEDFDTYDEPCSFLPLPHGFTGSVLIKKEQGSRVMREERRAAVFVHPARVYTNPGQ